MISYDELIQIYGYDLNIVNLYYNTNKVDFRGTYSDDGIYIVCKLDISINKFKQTKTEDVIVPLNMLHSLVGLDLLKDTIFKDLLRKDTINEEEIDNLLKHYDRYNKVVDSVFKNNNIYGVSYEEFNSMIRQNKINNQLQTKDSVNPLYSLYSDITISNNTINNLLNSYFLKVNRYFKDPQIYKIDIDREFEVFYREAKNLIKEINNESISAFNNLKKLIEGGKVNINKDIGGYCLVDCISNTNLSKQLKEVDSSISISI